MINQCDVCVTMWHLCCSVMSVLQGVAVSCLEVHPNNNRLLVHSRDNVIRMFDLRMWGTHLSLCIFMFVAVGDWIFSLLSCVVPVLLNPGSWPKPFFSWVAKGVQCLSSLSSVVLLARTNCMRGVGQGFLHFISQRQNSQIVYSQSRTCNAAYIQQHCLKHLLK